MPYQEQVFEKFAMQAEQLSQKIPALVGTVSVNDIADAAGIPREDGEGFAQYLHDMGWAVVYPSTVNTTLVLTPKGFSEIAKLRRPRWQRWIDQHPARVSIIVAMTITVIGNIISGIILYHLLK